MKNQKLIIIILALLVIAESIVIIFLLKKPARKPVVKITPAAAVKGKIAIVVDDFGYHQDTLPIISGIKYPMTTSVLPKLAYSSKAAKLLRACGFEIILHLPMEPAEKRPLEKDTILAGMSPEQISSILQRDLASIGPCKGVSNHMGSKLTADSETMRIIFHELKKRKLYFLDSFVSPESVCEDLAAQTNVKYARRSIFLDNYSDPAYIKMQLNKLKTYARIRGQAIGIGHDKKNTLEVLKNTLPELEKDGYKLVFVSDLIK